MSSVALNVVRETSQPSRPTNLLELLEEEGNIIFGNVGKYSSTDTMSHLQEDRSDNIQSVRPVTWSDRRTSFLNEMRIS